MGKKWNIYKKLKQVLENSGFRRCIYVRVSRQFTSIAKKVAIVTKDKIYYVELRAGDVFIDAAGNRVTVADWQDLYERGKIDNDTMFIPIQFIRQIKVKR